MGFVARLLTRELFSLSTIFMVVIPLLAHNGSVNLSAVSSVAGGARSFVESASVQNVGSVMSQIGHVEASAVKNVLGGHAGSPFGHSHGPIFLNGIN